MRGVSFMTSNETMSAVRALLESYRDAFEQLDAAAIADHFVYPSHITGDADEIVLLQLSDLNHVGGSGPPGILSRRVRATGCRRHCRPFCLSQPYHWRCR